MSIAKKTTLGEQIESIPKTILFFLFGASFLGVGFALEMVGMGRSAGLAGAFSVILMMLAVSIQAIYLFLGTRD